MRSLLGRLSLRPARLASHQVERHARLASTRPRKGAKINGLARTVLDNKKFGPRSLNALGISWQPHTHTRVPSRLITPVAVKRRSSCFPSKMETKKGKASSKSANGPHHGPLRRRSFNPSLRCSLRGFSFLHLYDGLAGFLLQQRQVLYGEPCGRDLLHNLPECRVPHEPLEVLIRQASAAAFLAQLLAETVAIRAVDVLVLIDRVPNRAADHRELARPLARDTKCQTLAATIHATVARDFRILERLRGRTRKRSLHRIAALRLFLDTFRLGCGCATTNRW
mmetsp:Transcript_444/g.1099  ORF Transcript_444/g.1099 Transcript_444/m.1099 type:complete len:281 (-) Transcript_444:119-961(-)